MNIRAKGRTAVQVHNDRPAVKVRGLMVGIEPDVEFGDKNGKLRAVGEVKAGGHSNAAQLRAHFKFAYQNGVPYLLITPDGKKPPMDRETQRVYEAAKRYQRMKGAKIQRLTGERDAAFQRGDKSAAAALDRQLKGLQGNKFVVALVSGSKLLDTLNRGNHVNTSQPSAGGATPGPPPCAWCGYNPGGR
jgi:hypothetical protein